MHGMTTTIFHIHGCMNCAADRLEKLGVRSLQVIHTKNEIRALVPEELEEEKLLEVDGVISVAWQR